jgi:hypothetical protein
MSKSNIKQEYAQRGYKPYISLNSKQTAERSRCDKCNRKMHYIGLFIKKINQDAKYINIAHCNNCGYEYRF